MMRRWFAWAFVAGAVGACGSPLPGEDRPRVDIESVALTLELVAEADADATRQCLQLLADRIQSREVADVNRAALADRIAPLLKSLLARTGDDPVRADAALLAATLRLPSGIQAARAAARDRGAPVDARRRAIAALVYAADPPLLELVDELFAAQPREAVELRGAVLAQLGRSEDPGVATTVLKHYPRFEAELQPKAVELLAQRPAWSKSLLDAIGRREIPASALNANQVARLLASKDEELKKRVLATWGTVRTERNPQREQVIDRVRATLRMSAGDAQGGQRVFQRVCGQCHKIHGEGQDVGPDITSNGRASLEQLLSNVLDPSLVIGAAYQARVVVTADGRVLTGLLVEDSPQRVALKIQGGKLEVIGRDDIEELRVSPLSMMPEGLETQLQPRELVDLFAFLMLDRPPADPSARRIPDR